MPGSALHLSPSAGRSVSLRFPLLLLLLPPSPVLPAAPGAPAPGRRPRSCPRRAPGPASLAWPPRASSLRPAQLPLFGSRCLGLGRGLSLSVGWGLSADPRGGVALARTPLGSFRGERADWDLGPALGKGTASLQALTCSGPPAVQAHPQQSRCFPCGPLSEEAAGSRGRRADEFSFSSL